MSAVPAFFRVRMAERFPNGHPQTENVVKREPNKAMQEAIAAIKAEREALLESQVEEVEASQ